MMRKRLIMMTHNLVWAARVRDRGNNYQLLYLIVACIQDSLTASSQRRDRENREEFEQAGHDFSLHLHPQSLQVTTSVMTTSQILTWVDRELKVLLSPSSSSASGASGMS